MAANTSSSYTGGAVTYMMSKDFNVSAGQMVGAGALISAYGEAEAQKAAAINQQTSYLLQARDTLAVSQVRAEFSEQYALIQAGRTVKKAELEAQNYQIAGNTLLKNMRATNASMRARAAASGVALGSGSIQNVIGQNVEAVMRDVNIADLNALTAKVLGFEDASAMLQSTDIQNTLSLYSARSQAGQFEFAGTAARRAGGMLASATLTRGGVEAYKIMDASGKTAG